MWKKQLRKMDVETAHGQLSASDEYTRGVTGHVEWLLDAS